MKNTICLFVHFLLIICLCHAQPNKIQDTGRVGIGTLTPEAELHVYRNSSMTDALKYNPVLIVENVYSAGYTQFAMKGSGRQYHIGVGNATESTFSLANKFFIWDQNATNARLVINPAGNVGIGTANPNNRLSIYGNTVNSSGLQFTRLNNTAVAAASNGKVLSLDALGNVILAEDGIGSVGWGTSGNMGVSVNSFIGTTDNKDLIFRTNNIERFRVFANGNFALGSSSDSSKKFQVTGSGYFSDAVGIGTTQTNTEGYKLFVDGGIRARKVKIDLTTPWPDYVFHKNYRLLSLMELEEFIAKNGHLPAIPSAQEMQNNGLDVEANQAALLKKIEELTLYLIEQNRRLEEHSERIKKQEAELESFKNILKIN